MPRLTKYGIQDKRANSSAANAEKARNALISYIKKGREMANKADEPEDEQEDLIPEDTEVEQQSDTVDDSDEDSSSSESEDESDDSSEGEPEPPPPTKKPKKKSKVKQELAEMKQMLLNLSQTKQPSQSTQPAPPKQETFYDYNQRRIKKEDEDFRKMFMAQFD